MTAKKDRHIAITGASSGIGAALAEVYAEPGTRLALAGRNCEQLYVVAQRCIGLGALVEISTFDVRDTANTDGWIRESDRLQPLDVVFANAGVGGKQALAGAMGESMLAAHNLIQTNLIGVINTVSPALSLFVPRQRGHIVLIGSLAGRIGLPHSPVYSASKAAVATYADALRRLVSPKGVAITLVEPGFVDTPMSEGILTRDLMLWSAQRAALAIQRGVAKRQPIVKFPFFLDFALQLARHFPRTLIDAILTYAHKNEEKL